jgi:hypothetical protein
LGGTKCARSIFYVSRYQNRFWRYRGRRVPFSCFALPDSFSTILRVWDLVFMFYALGLILDSIEGVGRAIFMFCAPGLVCSGTDGVVSSFHVF